MNEQNKFVPGEYPKKPIKPKPPIEFWDKTDLICRQHDEFCIGNINIS